MAKICGRPSHGSQSVKMIEFFISEIKNLPINQRPDLKLTVFWYQAISQP